MFHPTRASWALLSVWTEDCKLKNPGAPCTHKLLVTEASRRFYSFQGHVLRLVDGEASCFALSGPWQGCAETGLRTRGAVQLGQKRARGPHLLHPHQGQEQETERLE